MPSSLATVVSVIVVLVGGCASRTPRLSIDSRVPSDVAPLLEAWRLTEVWTESFEASSASGRVLFRDLGAVYGAGIVDITDYILLSGEPDRVSKVVYTGHWPTDLRRSVRYTTRKPYEARYMMAAIESRRSLTPCCETPTDVDDRGLNWLSIIYNPATGLCAMDDTSTVIVEPTPGSGLVADLRLLAARPSADEVRAMTVPLQWLVRSPEDPWIPNRVKRAEELMELRDAVGTPGHPLWYELYPTFGLNGEAYGISGMMMEELKQALDDLRYGEPLLER